jgi:hypothetical protein
MAAPLDPSTEKKGKWSMELFSRLFGSLLVFVYHCLDRVVINGYLSGLSRPEQVVYFFREVLRVPAITKDVLRQRTEDYRNWVEAFARNHDIHIEWAEKGVRKENHILPWLRRMEPKNAYGVYFIYRSMEQGPSFRSSPPRYPTDDPNYRILAPQRSRFTHYYFYIRDEVMGPMILRIGSFFPFHATYWINGHSFMEQELKRLNISFRKDDNAFLDVDDPKALQAAADRLSAEMIRNRLEYWTLVLGPKFSKRERLAINLSRFYALTQVEYCRNFIFKRNFPIRKIFERSCEIGLWRMTGHKISQVFGQRLTKRLRGKLYTTLERIDHGHHIFRAYFKNSFIKQYEKFSTFLRNEICSNNLKDLGLKKGLENLKAVRQRFQIITDRFAGFQAEWLNVHTDFSLLERLARPIQKGSTRVAGIKIHDTRMIRLMEVLIDAGSTINASSARRIHQILLERFRISEQAYSFNQLRYDLRKMKSHGLIARRGRRYTYALTEKGTRIALLFVLFHQRLFGPLAYSQFVKRPASEHCPKSKLERAYRRADAAIDRVVELLHVA